jgi:hypothetical protein
MTGGTNNAPMLKAAGLSAKTSAKGDQYLTGRLGGVKVDGKDPFHEFTDRFPESWTNAADGRDAWNRLGRGVPRCRPTVRFWRKAAPVTDRVRQNGRFLRRPESVIDEAHDAQDVQRHDQ